MALAPKYAGLKLATGSPATSVHTLELCKIDLECKAHNKHTN